MREVTKEDLRVTNFKRKWWQFWKPKYLPVEFSVNVVAGSMVKTKGKYKTIKVGKGAYGSK
jgi:hypothetical protein